MKRAGAAVLVLAAAVLLMGQASPPRSVEANQFIVIDANGKTRARLATGPSGPFLALYDANGKERAALHAGPSAPVLSLFDKNGKLRSWLHVGGLLLFDSDQKVRAAITTNEAEAFLEAYGPNGQVASMGVSDEETARRSQEALRRYLIESGQNDIAEELGRIPLEGGAGLRLSDKEGFETRIGTTDLVTPRTGETHKTSAASVVLFDKDTKVLWKAP